MTLRPPGVPHSYTRITPYGVSTQRAPGNRSGGYGSSAISAVLSCARSVRGEGMVGVRVCDGARRRRYSPVAAARVLPRTAWWKGHLRRGRREAIVVAVVVVVVVVGVVGLGGAGVKRRRAGTIRVRADCC